MPNLFPDIDPNEWDPSSDTFDERDQAGNGFVQINAYDMTEQWGASGTWSLLSPTVRKQIHAHFRANKKTVFSIFDFYTDDVSGLFVIVADGTSLTYTLPAKNVTGLTIKHNGVTAATQPTLIAGTGADGCDQIQYTSGSKPAAGVVITMDATDARRLYTCLYVTTKWNPKHIEADTWGVSLDFIESVAQ